jgi:hypothetical protein
MIKRLYIPIKVCSDYSGYSFLSKLHNELEQLEFEQVVLDFSRNTWFEANLCAVLGAIINQANANFNQISVESLRFKQLDIFSRNHFLAAFGGQKIKDHFDTTIKYRRNKLSDDKLIKEFLDRELINKPDFPKLSIAAKSEIIRSIFEIYSNAVIHGDCTEVFSCGQFYPRKNPPQINFTIVDVGRTIKTNVSEFLQKSITGIDAIEWALEENNTTKPKERNIPGGLGLKIICDFARLNNGKVQIVSGNGCWQITRGKENSSIMEYPFPGTLVNLEFNLDDQSFYYLNNEKSEDIIF